MVLHCSGVEVAKKGRKGKKPKQLKACIYSGRDV
jgi:hypothetical protein